MIASKTDKKSKGKLMSKKIASFNIMGEFHNKSIEVEYLNDHWSHHKKLYLFTYIICSFLLLLAGLFIDYNRHFSIGSPHILTSLRVVLLLGSFLMIPLYFKKIHFPKSFNYFGLALMILSSIIILLLNIMTAGKSETMLPGILIISASYYVVFPNRIIYAFIPEAIQILNFTFFYQSFELGSKQHIYYIFMLVSINIVMITSKAIQNKSSRTTILMSEEYKASAKAKDTILGIIGHDLRSPLTIIKMKSSILKKFIEKERYDKASLEAERIELASEKLAELLQSLLSWASSEIERAGK